MSNRFGSIAINSDKQAPAPPKIEPPPPRRPGPSQKKRDRSGKTLIFSLIACLLLVAYFLAGVYLVPALLKKYLPPYLLETAGLELTIEGIELNPLNFQLTFTGLQTKLPNSPTAGPLLQAESLFMDLDLTSLLRNGFVCDSLTIQRLQLNLIRFKDNSYNTPAIFHFSNKQNQGEIMDFAQLPFLFSLNNIDISDSRILYNDMLTGKTHSVEQMHLAIPTFSNFSFQSTNYIQPHFSAIVNGSPIQLSGEAVQVGDDQGFTTKLSCTIQALDLVPYFSYLPSSFPLTLSQGRADTNLEIFFSPQQKNESRLSIDIKMTASDIEMESKNEGLHIKTPALKMEGRLDPLTKRLHIRSIVAKEPQISAQTGHIQTSLQELLPHPSPETSPLFHLAIDLALADQGLLTLFDGKKAGSMETTWKSLQLSLKDFKTAKWNDQKGDNSSCTFRLSGEQEKDNGSFSWQGTIAESGKAHGKLLLNEFSAATLFDFLDPDAAEKIEGSTTFTGNLALFPWQKNLPDYILENGTLQIYNLELLQDKETWLEAESVRFTDLSRTEGRFQLGNIFLKGSTLNLNSDGELPALLKRFSTEKPTMQLNGIDFSGTLNLKTAKGSATDRLFSDFHFQANNLDNASSKDTFPAKENFALSAQLLPDGLIKAKGSTAVAPFQVLADLAFSNIDSSFFSPFFSRQALLQNSKATLHGKGQYRFPKPSFQGSLRLTDTVLQLSKENPLLSWELGEFSHLNCRFSPFSLTAETLSLEKPQLPWQRKQDDTDPFQQIQGGLKALLIKKNAQLSSGDQEELFPLTLKEISFQNGSLHYLDRRLSPSWSMRAENITGRIKNFNTSQRDLLAPFTLTGTLDTAPFNLSGAATLFPQTSEEGRAMLQLTDFPVASFHKQLASLKINPDSATLNLHLTMSKERSLFSSKAVMIIKDLLPAPAGGDTGLALALLKNREGTFPLTIQIEDGNRSLIKESMTSFQTTVIKATHAPLLLDPEFADLQDNNLLSFQPGSNKIIPDDQKTLNRYLELLTKHPHLALVITGMADRENDHRALLQNLEEKELQRVNEENTRREVEYRAKQQVVLPQTPNTSLQEEDIAKEDLAGFKPSLPNPVSVDDKELLHLARERGLLIHNFLARSLVDDFFTRSLAMPSDQVILDKEVKIIETEPGNRVLLTLKAIPPVAQPL
ncbi:MAG: DUF748 domain-containing protein [Proteobacteria bacterium]|nr:DUF748 domain-containing protein [Pseudomonadota bacterium]